MRVGVCGWECEGGRLQWDGSKSARCQMGGRGGRYTIHVVK